LDEDLLHARGGQLLERLLRRLLLLLLLLRAD